MRRFVARFPFFFSLSVRLYASRREIRPLQQSAQGLQHSSLSMVNLRETATAPSMVQKDPGPGFMNSVTPAVFCHAMHSTFLPINLRDLRTHPKGTYRSTCKPITSSSDFGRF
ncbi:uncharacterized protein LOC142817734 [Rhipicephalus microplus]|uniref:uncharacterized protein LOC142817734 n=1 Tax=Rhipicephalus microplus TaxID=6941 RepID=UPI003F6B944A